MMEQDTNKTYLKKLLDFLRDRILSNPSNRWFSNDLYKILAPESEARISDIHEQCIEGILQEQAKEFYKDFVIAELRPQLIDDFVKMEHWRRRNNIGEFGLAVFQQIECIMNHLSKDDTLCEVYRAMMNAPCYVNNNDSPVSDRKQNSTYTVAQLLFMHEAPVKSKELPPQLWIFDRFKSINYFVCHRACLTTFRFNQFVEENELFGKIYTLRNMNHRGNSLTDKEAERLTDICNNPSRAFLTLTSYLCWFVDSVNKGFPVSRELIEFAQTDFSAILISPLGPKVVGKVDLKDDGRKRFH